MNIIISNFLTASGFFEGDEAAAKEAKLVTKKQRREWERYGYVPISFFYYLARIGVIKTQYIPRQAKKPITLGDLLDVLRLKSNSDEQAKSNAAYIFRGVVEAEIPNPEFSTLIGLGDHVWQTLKERHKTTFPARKGGDVL